MDNQQQGNRDPKGYYAILGVSPDATAEELSNAYYRTIDMFYKNGDNRAAIEMVKHFYWTILQPDAARSEYDCGYKKPSEQIYMHVNSRFGSKSFSRWISHP